MQIKIEQPTTKDINQLIPLWKQQYAYHYELDAEYYVNNSPELEQEFRKSLTLSIMKNEGPKILIARVKDKIVGFITFETEENDYFDTKINKYGVVVELFVLEKYRNHGIASKLTKKVEKHFEEQDLTHIKIELSTFNTLALKFYEGKGYVNRQTFVYKNNINNNKK